MTQYQYRDAQTGEFVSQEYAEAHPDVTVRETIAPACPVCNDTGTFSNDFGSEFPCSHGENDLAQAVKIFKDDRVQQAIADALLGRPPANFKPASLPLMALKDSTQPDPDYIYLPDILALEADNKRLREAMEGAMAYCRTSSQSEALGMTREEWLEYMRRGGVIVLRDALSTPPLATSALWGILQDAAKLADEAGAPVKKANWIGHWDQWLHTHLSPFFQKVRTTLTPEDRALIEEMARGGGE